MFLPLELTLRPSRIYALVLAMAHGLALGGIWLAALPVGVQAAMAAAVVINMIWAWQENSNSLRAIRVTQSGRIELLESAWQEVRIKGQPVVLPWFVRVALVSNDGKIRRLMLWRDSAEPDMLRRLRVWLKLKGPGA